MVWKQATDCCPGTAAVYGAPDTLKISQLFSDTDVTDTVTIHETVVWTFQSNACTGDSMRISNPAQTFNYTFVSDNIAASRDVSLPILTADDTFVFTGFANVWGTANQNIGMCGAWQEGGLPISPIGTHTQWIPAGAWGTRTTNGATFAELELVTNDIMLQTFNFDTATEQGIQFWWEPPAEWDAGTITFNAKWTETGGAACGTVVLCLAGVSYSDSDAIDAAIGGTPATVTDTNHNVDNDMQISPQSGNVTINNATKGEAVLLELTRVVACDTLSVDAKLIGINITYTTDEATAT